MSVESTYFSRFFAICRLLEADLDDVYSVAVHVTAKAHNAARAVLLLKSEHKRTIFPVSLYNANSNKNDDNYTTEEVEIDVTEPWSDVLASYNPIILKKSSEAIGLDAPRVGLPWPGAGTVLALCPLRSEVNAPPIGILALAGKDFATEILNDCQSSSFWSGIARVVSNTHKQRELLQRLNECSRKANCLEDDDFSSVSKGNFVSDLAKILPGTSPGMLNLRRRLSEQVMLTRPFLLVGAYGTHKEEIGKALHRASEFSGGKFVYVDCAHYDDNSFLQEFVGVRRGVLPGRSSGRRGFLREASNGILFLDRVESIPLVAQSQIVRLMDDATYRPIGAERELRFVGRFVFATNFTIDQLREKVAGQTLDPRLYAQMCANMVQIPSLAECATDLPKIVNVYLARIEDECNRKLNLDERTLTTLAATQFPGNFKQLLSCLRSAVNEMAEKDEFVEPVHVIRALGQRAPSQQKRVLDQPMFDLRREVRVFERTLLQHALEAEHGNRTNAAKRLNLPKRTLADKCRKYGL